MGKKSGGRVRVKQLGPKGGVAAGNPLADLAISPEDLNLPIKPDSKICHFWPMSETFTMKYKKFLVIWPTDINSNKTVKLGRKISSSDSVPEPAVQEISEALQLLNVRHVIQPYKGNPRDTESRWYNPGRVLVDLENAKSRDIFLSDKTNISSSTIPDLVESESYDESDNNGDDMNKKVTLKALMRAIVKILPGVPSRIRNLDEKKKAKEIEMKKRKDEAKAAATASKQASGVGGVGGSKNKKKGKKRR